MWFKNLFVVQLTENFTLTAEELEESLRAHIAKPCGALQEFSYGWTSPLGRESDMLVHSLAHYHMLAVRKESKLLPSSIVRDVLDEKIAAIEESQGRKVGSREKASMRDEIRTELMTRAFHKTQTLYAYIDTRNNWLIIDTTNQKKAEEFMELLRQSVGKLDIATLLTEKTPRLVMSNWLLHKQAPAHFAIETQCQMIDPQDIKTAIKCVNHDLMHDEITQHLSAGKQVTELALTWQNQISLTLCDNLLIKRFQLLDVLKAEMDEVQAESKAERFDADFAIMTDAISQLLPAVFELFGGLSKLAGTKHISQTT